MSPGDSREKAPCSVRTISHHDYSGYGFGSIIWIPTETAFINPANILPVTLNGSHCGEEGEEEGDCDKYFVDPSVLQRLEINILFYRPNTGLTLMLRIPACFLLIGGIIALLSLAGISLLSDCKSEISSSSPELPSLTVREVLRTRIFYQVRHHQLQSTNQATL